MKCFITKGRQTEFCVKLTWPPKKFHLMEAFEGNRDIFKTFGEKAKSLGKVVLKEAKKAAGFHVGQVTEANPIYFIVVANQGAMVRKSIELDSAPVHGLRRGDLVTCVDLSGRRARIIEPVEGWVSTRTQENELILEVTIAPDKKTQVSQMEKRFEKLKAEQQQQPDDQDKAVPAPGQGSALPDVVVKESDVAAMNAIKAKLSFKSPNAGSTTTSKPGLVPKLSGPGIRRLSASDTAPQQDLLSWNSPKSKDEPIAAVLSTSPPLEATVSIYAQDSRIAAPNAYTDPFADLLSSSTTQSMYTATPIFVEELKVSALHARSPIQPELAQSVNRENPTKPADIMHDWFN